MDRLRRSLTLLAQAVARGRGLAHKSQLSRAAQHGTEHENCYQRARSKVLPMCPVAEDLGPYPLWVINEAARQWRQTKVFKPQPSEMIRLCQRVSATILKERYRLRA